MKRTLLPALLCLSVTGCMAGPNYGGPPSVVKANPAFHRAGNLPSAPPLARWWPALDDAELNRLEDLALAGSPDLAVAEARLRQSRAALRGANANLWPTTGATGAYIHINGGPAALLSGMSASQQADAGSSAPSDSAALYSTNFDAIWEVDLFGGTRRAIEGARAQSEAAQAQVENAHVTLTAEVAQAYVQLRNLQNDLALAQQNAMVEQRMLDLTQVRRNGGTATDLDVQRLTTQLETTQAAITPLRSQIDMQIDRLAVLTGQAPGALDTELTATAAVPTPPATVDVGDPSSLLQRRPDIRAAERTLAARTAAIGQQEANLFPKLTLIGALGWSSSDLGRLFDSGNQTTIEAPMLQWTPFDFGRRRASIGQAQAARDEAEADYRRTVLAALQDAEGSLSRYGRQRDVLADQLRVQASANRAAQLMDLKVRGGTATLLDQLDTERARLQAQQSAADAASQLTQDYIALQKSLGLGWQ